MDVTKYVDGVRSTLPGRGGDMTEAADAEHVWAAFKDGCSVRVLHPQRWCDPLWKVRRFVPSTFPFLLNALLGHTEAVLPCCRQPGLNSNIPTTRKIPGKSNA